MKTPKLSKIPITSGVYLFKRRTKIIYIGKAKNLRNRLRNYFSRNSPEKVRQLVQEATQVQIIKTTTEPDSLILESQLIKKHQPQYNIAFRDDKSYFYVAFTNDSLSRVQIRHAQQVKDKGLRIKDILGPFTDGTSLKKLIRQLRRLLHFCTCKGWHERPCIPASLGLCAGVCCVKSKVVAAKYPYLVSKQKTVGYKRNIALLKQILSGKHKIIVKKLEAQMQKASRKQEFEKAQELRDFIRRLEKIWQHSLQAEANDQLEQLAILEQMKKVLRLKATPSRIEGYDISNIFGTEAVGSMVVFTNGTPDKSQYRKFKIKTVSGISDVAMLQEVLKRRLQHKEWPLPDLFFIDGGLAQLNAAKKVLAEQGRGPTLKIPIIAFAKGLEQVWSTTLKKPTPLKQLPEKVSKLIVQIKNEAHRFAISYHRKLRTRALTKWR